MDANQVYDKAKNKLADAKQTVQSEVEKGMEESKESAQDWIDYVSEHPVQSVIFGIIGYYALKGFLNR